ncbi:recombination protein O N-terminal domain-containing protein [Mycoplasma buteonis]|uniref:recombination protein O N-terminal domain-containing protein n=1 Tax=Mycoplasma buteonis TaxID=171280 RepID=UPI000567FDE2|nr:recombination protein O N-terminal domain-containing protein [Mycoplasma buteonis]
MAETITQGIVLQIYQEDTNLFLVTFLTKKGLLRLAAQGLNKSLSKNKSNLQIGALVEIEFFAARLQDKVGKLKKATIVKQLDVQDKPILEFSFQYVKLLTNIQGVNHIFDKCVLIYDLIDTVNCHFILTFLYAQSMIYFGICPNFRSCNICLNERDLINFDLQNGGFICRRHENVPIQKVEYLQSIWYSFNDMGKYMFVTSATLNFYICNMYKALILDNGYYV